MEKILSLKGWGVGLALLALPFLLWGGGQSMAEQIQGAKLFGCFLLGNLVFSWVISQEIHPLMGFAHWAYAFSTWVSGFGPGQLYPFVYWCAAISFSLWFIRQIRKDQELMLKFVVASAVLSGIYAIIQMLGHDFIFTYAPGIDHNKPIAFFGQYTKFGSFAGCVGALAAGMELFIPWAFLGIMVLLTKSCFSIACFLVGSGLAFTHLYPKYKFHFVVCSTLGGILSALGVVFFQSFRVFYGHGRLIIWKATFLAWWHAPAKIFLLGFGPSSFRYIFPPNVIEKAGKISYVGGLQPPITYDHGLFLEAHNDYLNLLFENGLVGLLFMIGFLLCLFWALRARWWQVNDGDKVEQGTQAFLAAILVNSIGNFPFQQAPHFFLAILSACFVFWYSNPPTFEWKR